MKRGLERDISAVSNGRYHARFLRDLRMRLHDFVVEKLLFPYNNNNSAGHWHVEQILCAAVFSVERELTPHKLALNVFDEEDTYIAGVVNLGNAPITLVYKPKSHLRTDEIRATSLSINFGHAALIVLPLRHAFLVNSPQGGTGWCLPVVWRITRMRATCNTAQNHSLSPRRMFETMAVPQLQAWFNPEIATTTTTTTPAEPYTDSEDAEAATAQYTDNEIDFFRPGNEWLGPSHASRRPALKGITFGRSAA